jgi:hypothetical protein
MTPEEYLNIYYKEEVPVWLNIFSDDSTFKIEEFFQSRVVFYPGSGNDGHAVKVFGSSHSAHCFLYADYTVGAGSIKVALGSLGSSLSGYKTIFRKDLLEKDFSPYCWRSQTSLEQQDSWREHFHRMPSFKVQSFGFLEILQREEDLNDSHGAKRLAILFLGADGHAAYDALFCQYEQKSPFAVLLQDHGFGGNYSQFGRDGIMNEIAVINKRTPKIILVGQGTEPWLNFKKVESLEPTFGGWADFPRFLYEFDTRNIDHDDIKKINCEILSNSIEIELKKYYVYVLIDSRKSSDADGGIFYVGKGSNKRVFDHVKSVKSKMRTFTSEDLVSDVGDSNEKTDEKESSKVRRIKEIQESGADVTECIIGRFDTAEEAFAVEAVLIEWVYGRERNLGQLTNIQPGRYSKHIRNKGDLDRNERLDIPKKMLVVKASDGTGYLERQLNKLVLNNVEERAELMSEELRSLIQADANLRGLIDVSPTIFFEGGRYVGSNVKLVNNDDIVLRLQFTSKSLITNLRAVDEGKKSSRVRFASRMHAVGLETMGGDRYGWLPGWKVSRLENDDYAVAFDRIKDVVKIFRG